MPTIISADEIRGVAHYHTRVTIGSERDLDRLHQEEGEPAPWMDNSGGFDCEGLESIIGFCRSLIQIGDRKRRIFFARLEGLTWELIGLTMTKGHTPQAAENEFAEIMKDHPLLAAAFPERGRAGALPKIIRRSANNG